MSEKKPSYNKDITIKDIARLSGVSHSTVSRALNDKTVVNKKTKQLVIETAEKMGYRPNAIAKSLVSRQSKTIALIIPDITNPFFSEIAFTIEKYLKEEGYNLIISNTNWDCEIERERLDFMIRTRVDGIIIKTADDKHNYNFKNMGVPIILFSSGTSDETSFVDYNDVKGGFIATEHLINSGYKKIAFIGGIGGSNSETARFKGYKDALLKNNIVMHDDFIKYGNCTFQCGFDLVSELLKEENAPDAAFCINDMVALGVREAILKSGLNIPIDFGIVGYDDIFYSSLSNIGLTSISLAEFSLGKLLTQVLFGEMNEYPNVKHKKIHVNPILVVRETSIKCKISKVVNL